MTGADGLYLCRSPKDWSASPRDQQEPHCLKLHGVITPSEVQLTDVAEDAPMYTSINSPLRLEAVVGRERLAIAMESVVLRQQHGRQAQAQLLNWRLDVAPSGATARGGKEHQREQQQTPRAHLHIENV